MDNALLDLRHQEARQQPPWEDLAQLARVRRALAQRPALVPAEDVAVLRTLLADLGGPEDARIWVEGLPADVDRAGDVLGTLLVH